VLEYTQYYIGLFWWQPLFLPWAVACTVIPFDIRYLGRLTVLRRVWRQWERMLVAVDSWRERWAPLAIVCGWNCWESVRGCTAPPHHLDAWDVQLQPWLQPCIPALQLPLLLFAVDEYHRSTARNYRLSNSTVKLCCAYTIGTRSVELKCATVPDGFRVGLGYAVCTSKSLRPKMKIHTWHFFCDHKCS